MWICLNLKENNLPSACQSLKKKFILQSLLNIICSTPHLRLARLWQALEKNRHCLPLKQRVSTAVLCHTTAACSHLHLTGAVTDYSLLKPVFGNLGSKTGPKTALTDEGLQDPLQLSSSKQLWDEGHQLWASRTGAAEPPGFAIASFCLSPFYQPLLGGLWIVRGPELTEMHHAPAF